jgi:hypothetical protein
MDILGKEFDSAVPHWRIEAYSSDEESWRILSTLTGDSTEQPAYFHFIEVLRTTDARKMFWTV